MCVLVVSSTYMYHDFRLLIEHDCYIQMTHLEQRLSSNTHVLLRNVLFSFQVGNNFDLLTRDIAMRNGVKNSTHVVFPSQYVSVYLFYLS